jgi:hypothetical protein
MHSGGVTKTDTAQSATNDTIKSPPLFWEWRAEIADDNQGGDAVCRPKQNATADNNRKAKVRFRRRAAIEPRIGHLKSDFRLGRNRLKPDPLYEEFLFVLVSAIRNWALEHQIFGDWLPAQVFQGRLSFDSSAFISFAGGIVFESTNLT